RVRPAIYALSLHDALPIWIARTPPDGDTYNHLLVLAETDEGYRNLVKITSEASLHGFYYKPRVSKKFLAEHSKGLIALSGCLKGDRKSTRLNSSHLVISYA